jgi:hypothetical protein
VPGLAVPLGERAPRSIEQIKRRYKQGDWFHVPLGSENDAIGIITAASGSRLFGYFFVVPAGSIPEPAELKALHARDAIACALFSGDGLEQARWRIVATSLVFEADRWPFPEFATRGAFGRSWIRQIYDPQTLRIASRKAVSPEAAAHLPDARFASPLELEARLRALINGEVEKAVFAVCDLRSPLEDADFELAAQSARVQVREPLTERDGERLRAFLERRSAIELRIYGFDSGSFDARMLARFENLQALAIETKRTQHLDALRTLRDLRVLRIAAGNEVMRLDWLQELPRLQTLELRGNGVAVESIADLSNLRALSLVDTKPLRLHGFASAATLSKLRISHSEVREQSFTPLRELEELEIDHLHLRHVPDLSRNLKLRQVALREVRGLRDLEPLARAPALCDLRISSMPQLEVWDFLPLRDAPQLRSLSVEIGSRRKSREVYRLLAGT